MMHPFRYNDYHRLLELCAPVDLVDFEDHMGGFDSDLHNDCFQALDDLAQQQGQPITLRCSYNANQDLRHRYPHLKIQFRPLQEVNEQNVFGLHHFWNYTQHPELTFDHFVCSFNGSPHVSRKLLVAILHRFGWWDPMVCSKNFDFDVETIDGHLSDCLDPDQHRLLRRFFIGPHSDRFFKTIHSFDYASNRHAQNIHTLEHHLTSSWLHIVSETMSTSYYPFFTEKFLYSVVTRGLFLAYAQPGWHQDLHKFYGFRSYTKIFDYDFDTIRDPVQRLLSMMCMLSKFAVLSQDDRKDLYQMEIETIEYNYDHYFSRDYLRVLDKHV